MRASNKKAPAIFQPGPSLCHAQAHLSAPGERLPARHGIHVLPLLFSEVRRRT